jgi:hypothetical protein
MHPFLLPLIPFPIFLFPSPFTLTRNKCGEDYFTMAEEDSLFLIINLNYRLCWWFPRDLLTFSPSRNGPGSSKLQLQFGAVSRFRYSSLKKLLRRVVADCLSSSAVVATSHHGTSSVTPTDARARIFCFLFLFLYYIFFLSLHETVF